MRSVATVCVVAAAIAALGAMQARAGLITPVGADQSSYHSEPSYSRTAMKTIDGSGLTEGPVETAGHGGYFKDVWLTDGITETVTGWVSYDLGDTYVLDGFLLWNYCGDETWGDFTTRGAKNVDVYVSTDGGATWGDVVQSYVFTQGTYPTPEYAITYNFDSSVTGNAVKLDVKSNWGGSNVGLSEIRFTGASVPEPATIVLLSMGLLGLLCYAWRKRK